MDEYGSPIGSFANWSTDDGNYTVAYGKITCWRLMYFVHVVFAYLVVFAGMAAFITRLHPILHPGHVWAGRLYVVCMLWCCGTSLVIHNTGLPAGVLMSFIWVLGGLTVGWLCIILHRDFLNKEAMNRVTMQLETTSVVSQGGLPKMLTDQKRAIVSQKTCCQRVFSLKTFHGAMMFMSWMNLFGRIMASDQSGDFTCHTQPFYKPNVGSRSRVPTGEFEMVGPADPNYDNLPWAKTGLLGWSLYLSIGPFLFAVAFAAVWVGCCRCFEKKKKPKKQGLTNVRVTASTSLTHNSKRGPKYQLSSTRQ